VRSVSRRRFLRLGLTGLGAIALGAACAPAPPAPPPSGQAKPAEAPKPSQPAAATAAPPPAAATAAPPPAAATAAPPTAKPAEAAKPAQSAAATTAPAVKTAAGGKIVILLSADPPSLDSVTQSAGQVRNPTQDNIYEGLLTVDNEMKLLPNLATSWERIDATRTRFKLVSGARFHNGEPFNADAVVASVKRVLDPEAKAPVLGYLDTLGGAEARDPQTVDILTKGPDPIIVRRMSFLMIGPTEVLTKAPDSLTDKPIGTGPYKFVEWVKDQRVVLQANEEYWGPRKPTIKEVEYQPRKEGTVRLTGVKTGEAHVGETIGPDEAATLPKEQIVTGLASESMQLRPTAIRGICSDERVRRAISHAVDRDTLIKSMYGPYGEMPNGQVIGRTSFGYDPTMKDIPYDLDKAKALVKEAGAEGKELTIIGNATDRYVKFREIEQAVAAMIDRSGLKVNLKLVEPAEWLKALREVKDPPLDVWFGGAGNEMQDPDRIYGAYIRTGGPTAVYSNPEIDKLFDDSRAELDSTKRAGMLAEMARKIQADTALIPLIQLYQIYAISPKLKFEMYPSGIMPVARMELSSMELSS
jgi:peptide/nickel transport system substrate-binding protein